MVDLDELARMARELFGREITEEQARRYAPRLPRMARNVEILDHWARRLDRLEPAAVQRTPDASEIDP